MDAVTQRTGLQEWGKRGTKELFRFTLLVCFLFSARQIWYGMEDQKGVGVVAEGGGGIVYAVRAWHGYIKGPREQYQE